MKVSEIVYYCLDAIKAFSDDSSVNEDHIIFLLSKYRGALLQQYHNIKKVIPESNYQVICLQMENTGAVPCIGGPRLVSTQELPDMIPVGKPAILLFNGLESEIIEFVPFSRLKAVGWNKWKKNFIYASIGPDSHLYMTFSNPQAQYLTSIKLKGIFEDYEKAAELECEDESSSTSCDPMEKEFPIEVALVPDLIARVVKDALGIAYRPADKTNDGDDSLSDIAAFIRRAMKKDFNNTIEGNE